MIDHGHGARVKWKISMWEAPTRIEQDYETVCSVQKVFVFFFFFDKFALS
jgi:hypothetical protein